MGIPRVYPHVLFIHGLIQEKSEYIVIQPENEFLLFSFLKIYPKFCRIISNINYMKNMRKIFYALLATVLVAGGSVQHGPIDREAVLTRNNPQITEFDSLASLSVGNGEFAITVDATGLQTFPDLYKKGVPLGTQSQWGWHSFPNVNNYQPAEVLKEFDFGRGHKEIYSCQFREPGRQKDACEYLRVNPHRLHLGIIGL